MNYLMGIDLGTSGTKTVLFDENGKDIASSTKEYPLYQPKNGWSEQKPADWWDACVSTIREVLEKSGVSAEKIAGIGIAGQMHGLVMLDENGEVLRPSILWNDGRTVEECHEVTQLVGAQRLIDITANPALTGFTAGKILWVRKNEPELYSKCRHILLPKDYLRYQLTGVFATEVSDASGMNLLDIAQRNWSQEVLEALDIDESYLPKVYESYEVTGAITKQVAEITGLREGTRVVGGAGDNAAAAIGTGVVQEGKAFITLGTSGVIFAHAENVQIDPKGRVHTFCSAVPGKWAVMSCTLAAGGSLQWLRNHFFTEEMIAAKGMAVDPYYIMDQQADRIPIGANRLLYLPYLMGERSPILDSNARALFFGLSAIHTKYDMLRAVMEGVIYSQKECLEILDEMGVVPNTMVATGGGGKSNLWCQIMADVLDCTVSSVANKEGPALGVAILAGVGTGVYSSVEQACEKIIAVKKETHSIRENTLKYTPYYELYKQVYPSLKDKFQLLASL